MDEFQFEVETTTAQEMPIIVKDGRSGGVLRTTGAIGEAYAQRLEELRKLGYICIQNYSSNTGRHQNSTWLAPSKGFAGMEAWAKEMGALIVRETPPVIIVKEGSAGKFIGRGGETIKKIATHCGYRGHVKIVEAKKVGGTRILMASSSQNDGTNVLVADHHDGKYDFNCWWEFEGRIIGHEKCNSCREKPPEFQGLPTYSLRKDEIEVLEREEHPEPRMSIFESGKIAVASDDLELVWLVMKDLPGYKEARVQL